MRARPPVRPPEHYNKGTVTQRRSSRRRGVSSVASCPGDERSMPSVRRRLGRAMILIHKRVGAWEMVWSSRWGRGSMVALSSAPICHGWPGPARCSLWSCSDALPLRFSRCGRQGARRRLSSRRMQYCVLCMVFDRCSRLNKPLMVDRMFCNDLTRLAPELLNGTTVLGAGSTICSGHRRRRNYLMPWLLVVVVQNVPKGSARQSVESSCIVVFSRRNRPSLSRGWRRGSTFWHEHLISTTARASRRTTAAVLWRVAFLLVPSKKSDV